MPPLPRTPQEAVVAYDEAFNARDWDALTRLVDPDMHVDDRRTGLTGTLEGRDTHISNHQTWSKLVPDVRGKTEIIRTTERFTLWRSTFRGRDQYENPIDVVILVLNEWTTNPDGALLSRRGMVFTEEQLGEATAEYERLANA